jgi:two-component system, OmpR family, phosphate regulon sensor histidine kinase PhoR
VAVRQELPKFPWRLIRNWAFRFLAFLGVLSLMYVTLIRLLPAGRFSEYQNEYLFLVFSAVFFLIVTWQQLRFIDPLSNITRKARSLASGEEDGELWTRNPFDKVQDNEWSDVDESLNLIHERVMKGEEVLSRERQGIQTLVHSSGDPILAVDKDGYSIFFNSKLEGLVGRENLVQKHVRLSEIFREPEVLDPFQRVLNGGTSERLSVQLKPQGEILERFYSLNIVPLVKKESGSVYGAMGVFHDITELKRTEMLKTDFVANVSHELRTPLTSMKGYLQVIEEDIKSGQSSAILPQLQIVTSNVNRLTSLVSDLLDLSSLETGSDLQVGTVEVTDITESALQQLKALASAKNIRVEIYYGVKSFRADRKRVEQVLINLIQNAFKYIPENKNIWVSWETTANGEVLLKVKDNGPGIPAEHLQRIFERFYRVDAARSRALGGTGLGLAIVKHILQRHGGSVSVTSQVGTGTEFVCRFPS